MNPPAHDIRTNGSLDKECDVRPRQLAALIGRIGDRDNYFFIGDDSEAIRIRDSGRLFLGNDDDDLRDDSGAFRVTVYY
jgi:hypothetical protein